MYDFDFDNNRSTAEKWRAQLANIGQDPDIIYNYVGATKSEIEGLISRLELKTILREGKNNGAD
jgi:hypothetical protein